MLTKIRDFFVTMMGTVMVLIGFLIIAIIGVLVMFVGYFLLWGLIGLCIAIGVWFLIWAAIQEFKES